MALQNQMILVKGKDKTDSIASFRLENGKYNIAYTSSAKVYSYNAANVQVLPLRESIDPTRVIVTVQDNHVEGIDRLLDFGSHFRIVRKGKKDLSLRKDEVVIEQNCLAGVTSAQLFHYFKETAQTTSLVTERGINILGRQYEKIVAVSESTVLSHYFNPNKSPESRKSENTLIYPFGLNQSQKTAVENAFSSQVSIIQGPPGTGKTQTILNIIANAIRNGYTVAVVSNNNSATQNVAEKLEKKAVAFLTAFLGSRANKAAFLETQSGTYPDMSAWVLAADKQGQLSSEVKKLSDELNEMLYAKNRIAEIEQELLTLRPERHYFEEYFATLQSHRQASAELSGLSSQKLLDLWLEYENFAEGKSKLGFLKKLVLTFRFSAAAVRFLSQPPEEVIPFLQKQFYLTRGEELHTERTALKKQLLNYWFDEKMEELSLHSLALFRAELASHFPWSQPRKRFVAKDFRSNSKEFTREYPVILSTTYSIKGTLNMDHIYDYLIVDEASQVDLATGVLAFSCARNIVIVGDLKQLPNVLTEQDISRANEIWERYGFSQNAYQFSKHSLLSSAKEIWPDVPSVLLREHYRCHPKIIGFCNQKFYDSKLIVMTEDHDEPNVLTMYRTVAGNHARGHLNQRQIDVIKEEVLPALTQSGAVSIGIIAPYRDQVQAVRRQLAEEYEVATVHKFQGREKDVIILTSVDNVIGEFVDDPNMLNVAVSRAAKSLSVVISSDVRNEKTNYGDLEKYIAYNNCEVISSRVFSVFDLLYKGYEVRRRRYLKKHRRISVYDSENLMYAVIADILKKPDYKQADCAVHVSLPTLIKDYELLDSELRDYASHPMTHVDFLLFHKMDKIPLLGIEVDGTGFHAAGSIQAERDAKKNRIFEQLKIPLLRLRTDESGEHRKIEEMLMKIL